MENCKDRTSKTWESHNNQCILSPKVIFPPWKLDRNGHICFFSWRPPSSPRVVAGKLDLSMASHYYSVSPLIPTHVLNSVWLFCWHSKCYLFPLILLSRISLVSRQFSEFLRRPSFCREVKHVDFSHPVRVGHHWHFSLLPSVLEYLQAAAVSLDHTLPLHRSPKASAYKCTRVVYSSHGGIAISNVGSRRWKEN